MWELVSQTINDQQRLGGLALALAVIATLVSIVLPLFDTDRLADRMKMVASERELIRARERERAARPALRKKGQPFMKQIVERFDLSRWLGTETARMMLAQAGYRGEAAEMAFLFFRLLTPLLTAAVTAFYVFLVLDLQWSPMIKVGAVIFGAYLGIKAPEIFLKNKATKRQQSMKRAFPDVLDLMLICVQSGMSVEHALGIVADQIGTQSVELAEELKLTMAELSFLPNRKTAYDNLADRTGLDTARQISSVLSQAERYGTPLGAAVRTVSDESRNTRMMEAEKKAAALPPKLTVPMIVFFLPVLFAAIGTPAAIQVMAMMK